jgi:bifunctional enzyme CysN/CysC
MATGASTADLAVVLIDARQGVLTQTRRHSFIASLLGIRHIVVAVNKIDLVDFSQEAFDGIVADYMSFAKELGFASIQAIPLSARYGDNVTSLSPRIDWYEGPYLLEHLETVRIDTEANARPFRLPVQYVNRPNLDFRGFSGTIASGVIAQGDTVVVAKSGKQSKIKRIATYDGDLPRASEAQAVTLVLEDEIEVSRGNMLVGAEARPEVADRFSANVVWFGEEALLPGRSYLLRTETDQTPVTISEIKYRTDVNTFAQEDVTQLDLNEVGFCHLQTADQIIFDPYADNRVTGAFVLIDRLTNATVGAGMIDSALRQATNVHLQAFDLDKQARAAQKSRSLPCFGSRGFQHLESPRSPTGSNNGFTRSANIPICSMAIMCVMVSIAISAFPTKIGRKISAVLVKWRG